MDRWEEAARAFDTNCEWTPTEDDWKSKLDIPTWEKRFCEEVATLPWWSVARTLNSSHGHSIVQKWDDSAAEEALHNAKLRFYAEINNLPCEVAPPDPDLYIDEINWDARVNVELGKELDEHRCEEGEIDHQTKHRYRVLRELMWNQGNECNRWRELRKFESWRETCNGGKRRCEGRDARDVKRRCPNW